MRIRRSTRMGDEVIASKSKELLDRVRQTIRLDHYSRKTGKTYVSRIRRFHPLSWQQTSQGDGGTRDRSIPLFSGPRRSICASSMCRAKLIPTSSGHHSKLGNVHYGAPQMDSYGRSLTNVLIPLCPRPPATLPPSSP